MQYDPPMLTAQPANGLTCGIDWARDDHVIAIVDCNGRQVHRSTVEHSSAGLRELVAVLARTGATEVAIERPDGPVVDALLSVGIIVVVIMPQPAEEPARPLRLGGQKRRPVRRVCAGRHVAHRPGQTASAGPQQPRHGGAARAVSRPQGAGDPSGGRG